MYYLGIDTSNYTTSIALCTENGVVQENFKILLGVADGGRGLRQSDAVFAHVKNFPVLADKVRHVVRGEALAAIGYSATPRRSDESYMPCFLVGKAIAEMLAAVFDVPAYSFSHQEGHIMAALYSSGNTSLLRKPFVAFHVSGGTTEIVKVFPNDIGFHCEIIGGTVDLNAGQAIDRIGVMMGLRFPCGAQLEELAKECKTKIPKPHISVKGSKCNLSGLENLAKKLYLQTEDKAFVAAYTLDFVAETLFALSLEIKKNSETPILYAGGVMSNTAIKRKLSALPAVYFAEPSFSADNAAGIALLGLQAHNNVQK